MLKDIKTRLVTFRKDSLRYRIASYLFPEEKIANSKACTIHTVYIPVSLIFGVIFFIVFGIILFFGWICGHTPIGFKDRGLKKKQIEEGQIFYPYRYSPLTGKNKKILPWQVILVLAVLFGVYELHQVSHQIWQFFFQAIELAVNSLVAYKFYFVAVVALLGFFYCIGRFTSLKRAHISEAWGRICPKAVIVSDEEKS